MACTNRNGIAYGANEADVYPHNLQNTATKLSSSKAPIYASYEVSDAGHFFVEKGSMVRPLYFLTDKPANSSDYHFSYSIFAEWPTTDQHDYWGHFDRLYLYDGIAVRYEETMLACGERPCRVRLAPAYYQFRGKQMWWGSGIIMENPHVPEDAQCSWELLQ